MCDHIGVHLEVPESILTEGMKGYCNLRISEHYAIEVEVSIFTPRPTVLPSGGDIERRDGIDENAVAVFKPEVTGVDILRYHVYD